MGKARIRIEPVTIDNKVDRYLTKDLGNLAKKRLKMIKFGISLLIASIIFNIYQYLN